MTLSITTFSKMIFNVTTLSIKGLFVTLSTDIMLCRYAEFPVLLMEHHVFFAFSLIIEGTTEKVLQF
jgi:hypothetical protein